MKIPNLACGKPLRVYNLQPSLLFENGYAERQRLRRTTFQPATYFQDRLTSL